MMLSPIAKAVCATAFVASLLGGALAQNGDTVYASFIYARTGERTPALLSVNQSLSLTPYGAHQMYDMVRIQKCLPSVYIF
jgi:hypothetical protein